jgi:hypothetical protein
VSADIVSPADVIQGGALLILGYHLVYGLPAILRAMLDAQAQGDERRSRDAIAAARLIAEAQTQAHAELLARLEKIATTAVCRYPAGEWHETRDSRDPAQQ